MKIYNWFSNLEEEIKEMSFVNDISIMGSARNPKAPDKRFIIPPLTFGQEIEQGIKIIEEGLKGSDITIKDFVIYMKYIRDGNFDGTGPFEWNYGIFKDPTVFLKIFFGERLINIDKYKENDAYRKYILKGKKIPEKKYGDITVPLYPNLIWKWHNEYFDKENEKYKGCGSHLHVRPNEDYLEKVLGITTPPMEIEKHDVGNDMYMDFYQIYAETWNNLLYLLPLLAPFIYFEVPRENNTIYALYCKEHVKGEKKPLFRLRRKIKKKTLAEITPETVIKWFKTEKEYNQLQEYTFITPNIHLGKPLTYEIRACETHPVMLATLQRYLKEIIKYQYIRYIEKGSSLIQLTDESKDNIVEMMADIHNLEKGGERTIYDCMKDSDVIEFEEKLPAFNKFNYKVRYSYDKNGLEYKNAFDFFKELCRYLLKVYGRAYSFTEYSSRCIWFVANEGKHSQEPWENFWRSFAEVDKNGKGGEKFQWETVRKWNWEMIR